MYIFPIKFSPIINLPVVFSSGIPRTLSSVEPHKFKLFVITVLSTKGISIDVWNLIFLFNA